MDSFRSGETARHPMSLAVLIFFEPELVITRHRSSTKAQEARRILKTPQSCLKKSQLWVRREREREDRHAQVPLERERESEQERERERKKEGGVEGRRRRRLDLNRSRSAIPKQLSGRRPSRQKCSPEAEQCQHATGAEQQPLNTHTY